MFCAWQHASVFARCLFGRVGDSVCNVEVYFACIERCPLGLGMLRHSAVASGIGVLGIVGWKAMQQCQALALTTSIFPGLISRGTNAVVRHGAGVLRI